jgi:hypothetical protein
MRIPKLLLQTTESTRRLVEGVGAGSPVGEEQAKADGLEDTGNGADSNGIKRALLGEDLGDDLGCVSLVFTKRQKKLRVMTYRGSSGSHEDQ